MVRHDLALAETAGANAAHCTIEYLAFKSSARFQGGICGQRICRNKPGGDCHIAMRASSIAKAISATVACSGLAAAAGAAAFGSGSPYRDVLIVAGIDAFAIGLAACILVMIFVRDERPVPPVSLTPRMRSLENPEGHELKKMLVRHVAPEKPVTIGFPCDDPEAEQFAGQIGRFLHESSFTVVSFAPEPPTVSLDPGIGIDDGNHILVGPIVARRPTAASTKAVAPAPLRANGAEPVAAMHASGLGSS